MCLSIPAIFKMDVFKWGRRHGVASSLDARGGDPCISAPNDGAWSEMAELRPVKTESSKPRRLSRLKSLLRSTAAEVPQQSETRPAVPVIPDIQVPHHPLVDVQEHKRSVSVNRERAQRGNRVAVERDLMTSSSREGRMVSHTTSEHNNDRPLAHGAGTAAASPQTNDLRKTISEAHDRRMEETDYKDHPGSSFSQSPPLASTSRMRRHSESTTTEPTPITATFSSRHTSMTSATSAGAGASASIPPLLAEEEMTPPLPKIPAARSASTRRDPSTERPRSARSTRRQTPGTVGPQELVPSYDELWGA